MDVIVELELTLNESMWLLNSQRRSMHRNRHIVTVFPGLGMLSLYRFVAAWLC
jgi:hypothetical protein